MRECILADVKRGVPLFFGSATDMETRRDAIKKRCLGLVSEDDLNAALRILSPDEVDDMEYEFMFSKRRIPRRVTMRMQQ